MLKMVKLSQFTTCLSTVTMLFTPNHNLVSNINNDSAKVVPHKIVLVNLMCLLHKYITHVNLLSTKLQLTFNVLLQNNK